MKQIINILYNKLGVYSERTIQITNHIGYSFLYKGTSIVATFLLVPLTINYLDSENYGIWLTLSSFIAWFSFFDIGLGNGLRNKFAEAKAHDDIKLAQAYVSSAYYTIGTISFFLFLVFFIINFFIDWTKVFNTSQLLNNELSYLMPIVFGFFCLQLVVKLVATIYLADKHHSIQIKIQFITNVISLLMVWLLTKVSEGSLLLFGSIFSALPVIILLFFNFIAFSGNYKSIKPIFALWKKKYLKDIMGVGINFFVIQIAVLIMYSTDNFIISKLFSPDHVVTYNIAYKYFSIVSILFTIIVAPYWSSFTEAFIKKDFNWIKKSVNNVLKIWLLIPLLLIFMLIMANKFYLIWVGEKFIISLSLSLSMCLFVLLSTFNMIFTYFLNGIGKIRLQLISAVFSMIINIPLSIFFAKNLNMGNSGVMIATCCSLIIFIILRPIQYYKIINKKAFGIWNK